MSRLEAAPRVRFGAGQWDRASRRLSVRGEPAKIPWRVAECLSMLVDAGGEVVTKEEFQRQIWGGAAIEDSNLAQCVTALRRVLDPAPDGHSHIETVARVGYRLAVQVVEEQEEFPAPVPVAAVVPEVEKRGGRRWVMAGVAVVVLATAVGGGWVAFRRMEREQRAEEMLREARLLLRRPNIQDGARATAMLQEVMNLRPGWAPAQATCAEAAARLGKLSFGTAIDLARLAVKTDPNCGECLAVLGYVLGTRGWKWEEAGRHLSRAVRIDLNQVQWRLWYADWLAVQGRLDEALGQAREARRLNPTEPRTFSAAAAIRFLKGEYRGALEESEGATALDRHFNPGHYWAYRAYMQSGDETSAVIARSMEVTSWASHPDTAAAAFRDTYLAAFGGGGRTGLARAWLHEVREGAPREVHRYNRALWHMWIGEKDAALAELEAGAASKPYAMMYVAVDPAFEPLRKDPRFEDVCRRVGLRN